MSGKPLFRVLDARQVAWDATPVLSLGCLTFGEEPLVSNFGLEVVFAGRGLVSVVCGCLQQSWCE